jgi:RimJ/RimL family protein N-acetyltransferase
MTYEVQGAPPILCIEFGGTRIKYGFFPRKVVELDELTSISTTSIDTDDLLGKIPGIFNRSVVSPLSDLLSQPKSMISISIRGPVYEGQYIDVNDQHLPRDLKKACCAQAECEVSIENDAICFAKGCLTYQKLKKEPLQLPCLIFTLGSGVGAALVHDEKTITGIEISDIGCPFSALESTRKRQEQELQKHQPTRWGVHDLLGKGFVDWSESINIAQEGKEKLYTERFHALCDDMRLYIQQKLSIEIASFVAGGGNSRFIIGKKSDQIVSVLSPSHLQAGKVSSDIIQLLGCQGTSLGLFHPAHLFPSFAEIEAQRKRVVALCPHDAQDGPVTVSVSKTKTALVITVETLRLRILSVNTEQYLLQLIDLYGSVAVNRLVGTGATLNATQVKEKVTRWIKRWSDNNPLSGYVILEKISGDFVGQIILKRVKDKTAEQIQFIPGVVEIGYLSAEHQWNKKYGQEYTYAMVYHLLPKIKEAGYSVEGKSISSVMATARVDNIASNCILSKFLTYDGEKPRYGGLRKWYSHNFSLTSL